MVREGKGKGHSCPLCGNTFEEGETTACDGCPLKSGCDLIKCPNCGYEFMPGIDERN